MPTSRSDESTLQSLRAYRQWTPVIGSQVNVAPSNIAV